MSLVNAGLIWIVGPVGNSAICRRIVLISVEITEEEIIGTEEVMEVINAKAGVAEEIRIFTLAGVGSPATLEKTEGDLRVPRLSNSPFPHHQYKELLSDCHHNY